MCSGCKYCKPNNTHNYLFGKDLPDGGMEVVCEVCEHSFGLQPNWEIDPISLTPNTYTPSAQIVT